ncbi:unnamed protein product [Spirodela intermedia]|uniref:Uncharacterized protein n=1 Tax=Spirodela intermedia TaxID=51605 RepID=A0A7I8KCM1_SPIIN|nr:unnamed protein product [Spirodela intermedia]
MDSRYDISLNPLSLSLSLLLARSLARISGSASPTLGEQKRWEGGQRQASDANAGEFGFDAQTKSNGMGRGTCSYTVSIKTSCSSPRFTRDAISLAFGDVYHNEVYAPRLDDPASRAFERCSTDTFRISGPCGGRTCYLYLFRSGRDGWTPDSVKVYYRPGDSRSVVTFFYNVPIPSGVWYGFDLCHGSSVPSLLPLAAAAI